MRLYARAFVQIGRSSHYDQVNSRPMHVSEPMSVPGGDRSCGKLVELRLLPKAGIESDPIRRRIASPLGKAPGTVHGEFACLSRVCPANQ